VSFTYKSQLHSSFSIIQNTFSHQCRHSSVMFIIGLLKDHSTKLASHSYNAAHNGDIFCFPPTRSSSLSKPGICITHNATQQPTVQSEAGCVILMAVFLYGAVIYNCNVLIMGEHYYLNIIMIKIRIYFEELKMKL